MNHLRFVAPLAVLAAALAGGAAAEEACLTPGAAGQTLGGIVHGIDVYGARRYGDKPKSDAIDRVILLALDRATCVGSKDTAAGGAIKAVQLVADEALQATLRAWVGRHVTVDGALAAATSNLHRTAWVLEATAAREVAGGSSLSRAQSADLLEKGRVPVRIGARGSRFDACTGIAQLSRSSPGIVRERGSNAGAAVATIQHADVVHLCETSADGEWFGVVVRPANKPKLDCGVMQSIPAAEPYRGRCVSGWLRTDEVLIEAG